MPKRNVFDLPGQPHYVTFSTYQRRKFLSPERTRFIVMEVLQECLETHKALCHGFVVMPDHVHAILTVAESSKIASFLQVWKRTSSYRIKRFYEQELTKYIGLCPQDCPVWQARFYDFNLESDGRVNEKIDYMHNNPVVAGLTGNALSWRWSSAGFYGENRDVGVKVSLCR